MVERRNWAVMFQCAREAGREGREKREERRAKRERSVSYGLVLNRPLCFSSSCYFVTRFHGSPTLSKVFKTATHCTCSSGNEL